LFLTYFYISKEDSLIKDSTVITNEVYFNKETQKNLEDNVYIEKLAEKINYESNTNKCKIN
jgi:hypothetical protein